MREGVTRAGRIEVRRLPLRLGLRVIASVLIRQLEIGRIHVPVLFRASILSTKSGDHAAYQLTLTYGDRYGLWMVAVER